MRKSPCTPLRVKAKGKEIKPDFFGAGLSRATRPRMARPRKACIRACVAAAVDDALAAFGGTRGPGKSDEALWANFAWRFGYGNLIDATIQGISEMTQPKRKPIPDEDKPKVLQNILNGYWKRGRK